MEDELYCNTEKIEFIQPNKEVMEMTKQILDMNKQVLDMLAVKPIIISKGKI